MKFFRQFFLLSVRLEIVDSAMFTICFDDWVHTEATATDTVKNLICGPNVANRWFDKSFRLFLSFFFIK